MLILSEVTLHSIFSFIIQLVHPRVDVCTSVEENTGPSGLDLERRGKINEGEIIWPSSSAIVRAYGLKLIGIPLRSLNSDEQRKITKDSYNNVIWTVESPKINFNFLTII